MSLFRDLTVEARNKDLGKNALKVFLTLLEQTLGYGKKSDNLTDRRLSYLSQVRIDRLRPAIQTVLENGLFDQEPAKRYQYCYTIGGQFLIKHYKKHGDKNFFTPALPKNGTDFQKAEAISEKERHTALDLNPSLSNHSPLETLLAQSFNIVQQQTNLLENLFQTQNLVVKTEIPAVAESPASTEPATPRATAEIAQPQSPATPSEPNSVGGVVDKIDNSEERANPPTSVETPAIGTFPTKPLSKAIADSLPDRDHTECYELLSTLSPKLQQDMLWVYNDLLEKDKVRAAMPLFRGLIQKGHEDDLTVPGQYVTRYTPAPPCLHETAQQKLNREQEEQEAAEQEKISDDESLREMLRCNSKLTNTSPEKLAKKLFLTHLLPV